MLSRITIDLPKHLAEHIHRLAIEHMRYPKQEIIWLLQKALEEVGPAGCAADRGQRDIEVARAK
jgi:hypothetical protein